MASPNPIWEPDENLRRIVCAACWFDDGLEKFVLIGPRHWDMTMRSQYDLQQSNIPYGEFTQGFIDNFGKLHSRKDALIIARRMNQVLYELNFETDKLYSEMLY